MLRASLARNLIFRSTLIPRASAPFHTCHTRLSTKTNTNNQNDNDITKQENPRPLASHPSEHRERPVSSGEAVAEHSKEDETERGGVNRSSRTSHEASKPSADPAPLSSIPSPALFSLANRTTLITGGGRGLGLTIARSLLESGSNVNCMDVLPCPSEPEWSSTLSYAKSKNLRITYEHLDVTDQESIVSLFSRLFKEAPKNAPVRGLFTSAGIQLMQPATGYTAEQFKKVLDVNLTGTFLCAQAYANEYFQRKPTPSSSSLYSSTETEGRGEAPMALPAGEGASIVLTGSMSGHIANLGIEATAYNASKAGVNQLAKNLALEWSQKGIRVNSLSPGYIRTALTAAQLDGKPELHRLWLEGSLLGRLSTPDEFRGPVIYLLSNASSFMTGADLLVDGGHCAT